MSIRSFSHNVLIFVQFSKFNAKLNKIWTLWPKISEISYVPAPNYFTDVSYLKNRLLFLKIK